MSKARKYLTIESYTCPQKDCPYVVAPGMAPTEGPPMALKVPKSDSHGRVRERVLLLCPVHQLGLTKNVSTQRIEPYKGTPRAENVIVTKKPNLPKLYTRYHK